MNRLQRREEITHAVRGFAATVYEFISSYGSPLSYKGQWERNVQNVVNAITGGCENDTELKGSCPVHPHGCPLPGAENQL